ncbi:unnamed protein product [Withania somnifera]
MAKEGLDSFSTFSTEQYQRIRQSKGNQELNDELIIKANELEKLFAEHKLRATPGNQSSSNTTSRHDYTQSWPSATSSFENIENVFVDQVFDNDKFREPAATISVDKSADHDELMGFAGSPGKFYDMYMQKRDAKIREEWNSKGAEKEEKLRAMEDSFERSSAEMKTMERLRSFNSSSSFGRDQQSDDREDMPEFMSQKRNDELKSSGETPLEEVSKNTSPRKKQQLPIKTSSKPRTIVATVPRSPMKVSTNPSYRRKSKPESPVACFVPNLSYMRKENPEPYSPAGKTTTRAHYSRNKLLHSQSLRTSSVLNSEGVILAPLEFDDDKMEQSPKCVVSAPLKSVKDKTGQNHSDKLSNISDTKTSLKKGKDAEFISRGGLIESRNSNVSSRFAHNDDGDVDDMELDSEDSEGRDEDNFENMISAAEEKFDNGTPRPRHEMEKVSSGSENRCFLRSSSQVYYASDAGYSPSSLPSNFLNSHEMSDVDASDSPRGSPQSWNSHFLSTTHTDGATRTRKKWGTTAQNPINIVKSSQSLPHKDKARGFKGLFKFGRKTPGADGLVKDWISATTSKGDDCIRKGHYSPHPSDVSLYEDVLFNERTPRSFFSLSSFRSKGKDSKPR